MNPKVFISHATEDKERFVREFAKKLKAKGIDAWIDECEILPGDSLVQKIFNEGLKEATAVIVILSEISVNKAWVREEIDAAFIKRVNQGSKLIPIVIDDCTVPVVLHSTAWQKIPNLTDYEKELDRVVTSILGGTTKPPIGPLPRYIETIVNTFPGLARLDALVLTNACEMLIQKNDPHARLISESLFKRLEMEDVPKEAFDETIEILAARGYISGQKVFRGGIPFFRVSLHTFDDYLKTKIETYDVLVKQVALEIVNGNLKKSEAIAIKLEQPHIYIAHLLDVMESGNLISLAKIFGGSRLVRNVSAELKRRLHES